MLKYKVIENFISENECRDLINDANKYLNINSEKDIISNNRQMIISTSIIYNDLLKYSKNWVNLNEKINSNEFYRDCLKNLHLESSQFELNNFFFKKKTK